MQSLTDLQCHYFRAQGSFISVPAAVFWSKGLGQGVLALHCLISIIFATVLAIILLEIL